MTGVLVSGHLLASVYFDSCLEIHNNIMRYELRNFESVNIYLEGEVYKVRIETVATRSSSTIPLLVFDTFMFRIPRWSSLESRVILGSRQTWTSCR